MYACNIIISSQDALSKFKALMNCSMSSEFNNSDWESIIEFDSVFHEIRSAQLC